MNSRLHIADHSLIKRDLSILRNVTTDTSEFRLAVKRISMILAVEISKNLPVSKFEISTPLEKTDGFKINLDIVLVPVLRAGLGMVSGFIELIPDARVGHIGLQRDEQTLKPTEYYYKTPADISSSKVIVLDPMLATGGSASEAVSYLKKRGARDIAFACLLAAPEGVKKLTGDHPEIDLFCSIVDRELNDKGYILPGLGDAGDRTFGTL